MFDLIPLKKFSRCLLGLSVLLLALKWGTDTCLPVHYESKLFPDVLRPPEFACNQLLSWELWSRSENSLIFPERQDSLSVSVERSQFNPIHFGNDIVRLPLLLERAPADSYPVIAIVTATIILAAFLAILWNCISYLVNPTINSGNQSMHPRRLTATKRILDAYTPSSSGFPLIHYRSLFKELDEKEIDQKIQGRK